MPPPLQQTRLCVSCNFVVDIPVTVQCALFRMFAYVFALNVRSKACKDTTAKLRDKLCAFGCSPLVNAVPDHFGERLFERICFVTKNIKGSQILGGVCAFDETDSATNRLPTILCCTTNCVGPPVMQCVGNNLCSLL